MVSGPSGTLDEFSAGDQRSDRLDASAKRVVGVCTLVTGVGAALGFIPGFIATDLRADLGISRAQVGLLISLYFGATGLGSVFGGWLTERLGARRAVALDMAHVAVAALFGAAMGTYWSLVVGAVIAGAGYALVNAATNVAVGRVVPPRRRTLALSVKTAGVPMMAAITASLGPPAARRWGWAWISLVVAAISVAAMIAALVTLADDRPVRSRVAASGQLPERFVWFPVGAFLLIAGSQPLYSWMVPYLEQSLDASASIAGASVAIASLVGVVFMIANALQSDRNGPTQRRKRLISLIGLNAIGVIIVLMGEVLGVFVVLVGAVIGIAAQLSAIGIMHATVVHQAPHGVARATGWVMTGYYLGALLSPVAFGAMVDATGTFAYSWSATFALLLLAILAWLRTGHTPTPPVDSS